MNVYLVSIYQTSEFNGDCYYDITSMPFTAGIGVGGTIAAFAPTIRAAFAWIHDNGFRDVPVHIEGELPISA